MNDLQEQRLQFEKRIAHKRKCLDNYDEQIQLAVYDDSICQTKYLHDYRQVSSEIIKYDYPKLIDALERQLKQAEQTIESMWKTSSEENDQQVTVSYDYLYNRCHLTIPDFEPDIDEPKRTQDGKCEGYGAINGDDEPFSECQECPINQFYEE